ncbi:hypothetical protein [Parasporobacterium paucivorans]|uniref:Uncharacterized protein n=1 Tax=Parasporobacterium paucivorans DSM 15970 TaxID=1122934 RepID=A0A1M6FSD1_9FIRM|nr:hypothetical protein [Parasporobacterium paucivorans]SHJ00529.1 hypothetical protein SAMN02745691_01185 [Parasporobacterium paucivorans DSM 15970]
MNIDKFYNDMLDIMEWVNVEEQKVTKMLQEQGVPLDVMNDNYEEYAYILEERDRRMADMKEKYNIKD